MEVAKVRYLGHLRTEATHLRSSGTVMTDAPVDNRGKGEAFSPTDLVATALGSCILTVMGIKAESLGADMTGATAGVTKVMAAHPRRIAGIRVVVYMPHDRYPEKVRSALEAAARHCPVSRSLAGETKEVIEFKYG